ncbi:hypothetical protein KKF84_13210 [Myxococcota bacterium]|nr:hypothetical protein [Myxococcota bacterium]
MVDEHEKPEMKGNGENWYCPYCSCENPKGALREIYEEKIANGEPFSGDVYCGECSKALPSQEVFQGKYDLLQAPCREKEQDPVVPPELQQTEPVDNTEAKDNTSVKGLLAGYYQAAEMCLADGDDTDQALTHLEDALELDPANRETQERLVAIYERIGEWDLLMDILAEQAELVGTADEVAAAQKTQEVTSHFLRMGQILEEKQNDPHAAWKVFLAGLELCPGSEELWEPFKRLTAREGAWKKAATMIITVAKRQQTPEVATSLYLKAATLYFDAGKDDEAKEMLKVAKKGKGHRRRLWECYATLYMRRKDFLAAVTAYVKVYGKSSAPQARHMYASIISDIYKTSLEDEAEATRWQSIASENQ